MTIYLRLPAIFTKIIKMRLTHMINSQNTANRYKISSQPLSILIKYAFVLSLPLLLASQPASMSQQNNTVLKGGVKEQNYMTPTKGPSLDRGDIKSNRRSFWQRRAVSTA